MPWVVVFHSEFQMEAKALPIAIYDELLKRLLVLQEFGPGLGRPNVDTLKGSKHANMKELRFHLDGLWRFAFAFDPNQAAIVLVGGDKQGANQKRFYAELIRMADARFSSHLSTTAQTPAVTTRKKGK